MLIVCIFFFCFSWLMLLAICRCRSEEDRLEDDRGQEEFLKQYRQQHKK